MLHAKIGKDEFPVKDRKALADLLGFVETKAKIDALNEVLKGYKSGLVEKAREIIGDSEAQTLTFVAGDDAVKVSFGYDIKIDDEAALVELLGERFDDLVKTVVSYKPETKLKEMALEDDGIKSCLKIKEKTPSIAVVKP